ncbi:MAG TPA: FAD-dependent oxidoreductase [Flavobacterium sp.]|nr:FAD-dependent oxidoreductase [Flavobacterium sp.]
MELSFWERQQWFSNVDYTIVGSGIVGLHTALRLRERFPQSKVLVLERGTLPQGASTKNAGFACFGSLSEILDDLDSHTEEQVFSLVEKRWRGLSLLRKRLGDRNIGLEPYGGYEVFEDTDDAFGGYLEKMPHVNELLRPLFNADVFNAKKNAFGFKGVRPQLIFNPFEAQIDTGKMMDALLRQAVLAGVMILNRQTVTSYAESSSEVEVVLDDFSFKTRHLLFATNGFAQSIIKDVKPARAQVLITSPIPGLEVKGTFHIDRGFYYFRNVGNRILLGGGRNLDFKGETTTGFGLSTVIQDRLEDLLSHVILPGKDYTVEHRWSGIMGVGAAKSPIVKQLSNRVYCGVRLGGMGVAIGSLVGTELADLVQND